jgi:hypothetical protein
VAERTDLLIATDRLAWTILKKHLFLLVGVSSRPGCGILAGVESVPTFVATVNKDIADANVMTATQHVTPRILGVEDIAMLSEVGVRVV